jgi:hypothetical protein
VAGKQIQIMLFGIILYTKFPSFAYCGCFDATQICWLNTIESHILVVNSDIILVESLICLWQQTNAPQHVPNMLALERVLVHLLQCLLHLAQNGGLNAVLQEASTKIKLLGPGE